MKKILFLLSSFIILYYVYAAQPNKTIAVPCITVQNQVVTPHVATFTIDSGIDIQATMDYLFAAANDESIHAITLYINHPGGECGPHSALHDLIKAIRLKKPVVAFITGYAYSCGYMIASAADYIICASGAGVGAIGTIWVIHKHNGVTVNADGEETETVEVLTAGKYKALENPLTAPLNKKTRKHLQAIVNENYQYFIKLVADNRNISLETSEAWAEGREFMSEKALSLGLIDQIGTLFDVEQTIVTLLKMRQPDTQWSEQVSFVKYRADTAE